MIDVDVADRIEQTVDDGGSRCGIRSIYVVECIDLLMPAFFMHHNVDRPRGVSVIVEPGSFCLL